MVYLTATPIANSMCEAHVFMRSLQAETLDRLDLLAFDAWARQFGEAVPGLELAPDGGSWRMVTRFAKFVNLPELGAIWRQVMTVKAAKDMKLDQPEVYGNGMQPLVLPMSTWLRRIVEILVERAEQVRSRQVEPHVDNMLKITGDGRKAALDVRLFSPTLPMLEYSKVRAAARFVFAVWQASEPLRGTQMVFCDLSVPRARDKPVDLDEVGDVIDSEADATPDTAISVYVDFARELVAMGVPAREIAFIHQAKNRREKQELFDKMNSGEVRILLGSTERMGSGTNAQRRLVNMIHLDPTWTPAGLIQRTGRIVRQGNLYPTVGVWCMQHEGSFDVFMYQTLLRKISFISQALSGDLGLREMEDVGDLQLTFEDLTAAATGNPAVQRKAWLEREAARLQRLRRAHEDAHARARIHLNLLPDQIRQRRTLVAGLEAARDWLAARPAQESFSVVLCSKLAFSGPEGEQRYMDRASAGEQLIRLADYARTQAIKHGSMVCAIGSYRGMRLNLDAANYITGVEVLTRLETPEADALDIRGRIAESAGGVFASLDAHIRNFPDRVAAARSELIGMETRERELTVFIAIDWDKSGELQEVTAELAAINETFKREAAEAAQKSTSPEKKTDSLSQMLAGAMPAESYMPASDKVEQSWDKALAFVQMLVEMHADPEPLRERLRFKSGGSASSPVVAPVRLPAKCASPDHDTTLPDELRLF